MVGKDSVLYDVFEFNYICVGLSKLKLLTDPIDSTGLLEGVPVRSAVVGKDTSSAISNSPTGLLEEVPVGSVVVGKETSSALSNSPLRGDTLVDSTIRSSIKVSQENTYSSLSIDNSVYCILIDANSTSGNSVSILIGAEEERETDSSSVSIGLTHSILVIFCRRPFVLAWVALSVLTSNKRRRGCLGVANTMVADFKLFDQRVVVQE